MRRGGHVATSCVIGIDRRAVLALWTFFVVRLVFVALTVPPWQGPDEPFHLANVRALALQQHLDIEHRQNFRVEYDILQSMAENRWWEAYQEPRPDPVPPDFNFSYAVVLRHMNPSYGTVPVLYYVVASRVVRVLQIDGLIAQYYTMRAVAFLLTLATFWVIVRGTREWFDDRTAFCAGMVVAAIPEFALIGLSVGPDPLVFLAGAVVWWQGGRLAGGKASVVPVAAIVAATAAAALSKRLGATLIVQSILILVVAFAVRVARQPPDARRSRRWASVAVGIVVLAVLMLAGALSLPGGIGQAAARAFDTYPQMLGWHGAPPSIAFFLRFTWELLESAYVIAGWLRFPAPPFVSAPAVLLLLVICACGVWAGVRTPERRVATVFALVFVLVQAGAIYGTEFYRYGPQGRFLFPSIAPFAALCGAGLVSFALPRSRPVAIAALGVMAALDLAAWAATIVRAYAS